MGKAGLGIYFAVAIIATIVTLDLLFFRDQPLRRLMANIAVATCYAAIYFAFFKK